METGRSVDTLGLPAIVSPLRPRGRGWTQIAVDTSLWPRQPYVIEGWRNRVHEVQVFSAVESVRPEGETEPRLEYHISITGYNDEKSKGYRCSASRARWVLREFGLDGHFEDNHVPHGIVRNFWRPVAEPLVGQVCPCVDEEPAMREMKGDYIWRGAPR